MKWIRRDIRKNALIAAPAFALALAACGGGANDVSSEAASAPPAATAEADSAAPTTDATTAESTETTEATAEASADSEASAAPAATSSIQKLSADEAIANAEVNQPNLVGADDVLDIETLAVADGSIQTLRDVVDGDRPVLLWFFSPH